MTKFLIKKEILNKYFETNEFTHDYTLNDFGYDGFCELDTYEHQIFTINKYPDLIRYIDNPSDELQILAVDKDEKSLRYIENPCNDAIKIAARYYNHLDSHKYYDDYIAYLKIIVRQNPFHIKYMKNPPETIQKIATQINSSTIKFINNPCVEAQKIVISDDIHFISDIHNPSEKAFQILENKFSDYILTIDANEETRKNAVMRNAFAIKYINNPSKYLKMLSVMSDENSIQYIKNPEWILQSIAVQKNGASIKFIDNPYEKIQRIAVDNNGQNIKYINNPTEKIQKNVLFQDRSNIRFFENPNEKMQRIAISNGHSANILHINNPAKSIVKEIMFDNPRKFELPKYHGIFHGLYIYRLIDPILKYQKNEFRYLYLYLYWIMTNRYGDFEILDFSASKKILKYVIDFSLL